VLPTCAPPVCVSLRTDRRASKHAQADARHNNRCGQV